VTLFIAILLWVSSSPGSAACQSTPPPAALSPGQVIDLVNQSRISHGLPALIVDPILMGTAQSTADSMAANQMHSHIGGVKERVAAAGYGSGDTPWATENFVILMPGEGQDQILQAWADEAHMAPMVNPNYKHVGAGVAEGDGLIYYILHAAYTSDGKYKLYQTPGLGTPTAVTLSQYIYAVQTVTPQADGSLVHIIKPGQSLWSIAIAYGTHINELQRLNGFASDNTTVYSGQKLLIPTRTGGPLLALSITPEPGQNDITITMITRSESLLVFTPTYLDNSTLISSATPALQTKKGSTQTGAIMIIIVLLFGTSLVATGSLWKKTV